MNDVERPLIRIKQVFKILVWVLGFRLIGINEMSYSTLEHNDYCNFRCQISPVGLEISKPERSCMLKVLELEQKGVQRCIFLQSFLSSESSSRN